MIVVMQDEVWRPKVSWRWLFIGAAGTACLFAIGLAVWWLMSHRSANLQTSDPKVVVAVVNKLYKLPADETPTVARIKDTQKLPSQSFYKDAKTGDYLLVYSGAKLAVLYRPSEGRLITVAPITQGTTNAASTKK